MEFQVEALTFTIRCMFSTASTDGCGGEDPKFQESVSAEVEMC